jgi:2-polyprenyl-3-methyl-5-hydroxy-6-metoxy-1,4-benzoquinol methylase
MENQNEKLNISCLVCGNKHGTFFTNKNGYNLFRCGCGLIFAYPLPQETQDVYGQDYFNGATAGFGYVDYDNDKEAMISAFNRYLDLIEGVLPAKGRLLDIGAATGFFMKIARGRGWETTGIELSRWAAAKGQNEGLNIIAGSLEKINFPPNFFDAVCLIDVLEHLPDPDAQLKIVSEILRPGGVVAINTPDASSFVAKLLGKRWHLLVPPEHIVYFNSSAIKILLRKNNLEAVYSGKIGKKFSLKYIAQIVANWRGGKLLNRVAMLIKNNRFGSISLPLNLRDNLFIIAKKRI